MPHVIGMAAARLRLSCTLRLHPTSISIRVSAGSDNTSLRTATRRCLTIPRPMKNRPTSDPASLTIDQTRSKADASVSMPSARNITVGWSEGFELATPTGIAGSAETILCASRGCHAGRRALNIGSKAADMIAAAHTRCRSAAGRLRKSHVAQRAIARMPDALIIFFCLPFSPCRSTPKCDPVPLPKS